MKIEIFGTGCAKCNATKAIVNEVLKNHMHHAEVIEVKDIDEIIARGVVMTPAIAVDGEVKISGHVPTAQEMEKLLDL